MNSQDEAKKRINQALALIEQAQNQLGEATQILSRVLESDLHWKHVSKACDDIHELWRLVNMNTAARKFEMDSDWKENE